jgi:hypothetical protein
LIEAATILTSIGKHPECALEKPCKSGYAKTTLTPYLSTMKLTGRATAADRRSCTKDALDSPVQRIVGHGDYALPGTALPSLIRT